MRKTQQIIKMMIDSNIFDKIVSHPSLPDIYSSLDRDFIFLTTPLQEEEIEKIPSERRRLLLRGIPRQVVPLVFMSDLAEKHKHYYDQQIALTAQEHANVLITEDQYLAQWCQLKALKLEVWSFAEFISWFEDLLDSEAKYDN